MLAGVLRSDVAPHRPSRGPATRVEHGEEPQLFGGRWSTSVGGLNLRMQTGEAGSPNRTLPPRSLGETTAPLRRTPDPGGLRAGVQERERSEEAECQRLNATAAMAQS